MADKNVKVEISTEFEVPVARTNLISGEQQKSMFGKIARWFSDLKNVAFTGSYVDLVDTPTIVPRNHASSATTYGIGTGTNYGHCRTINNLTTDTNTNGYVLSAYQGYLLAKKGLTVDATVSAANGTITLPKDVKKVISVQNCGAATSNNAITSWAVTGTTANPTLYYNKDGTAETIIRIQYDAK